MVKEKRNTVFKVFLKNLFVLLVIPLIIVMIIYFSLTEKIYIKGCENNLEIVKSCADRVENLFASIDEYIEFLRKNSDIAKFYNKKSYNLAREKNSAMLQAQELLSALAIANDDLLNIQLYSEHNDMLVDFYSCALYVDRYYKGNFFILGEDYGKWRQKYLQCDEMLEISREKIYLKYGEYDALIYNSSHETLVNGNYGDRIIFIIDMEKLISCFAPVAYQDHKSLYILDEEYNPIVVQGDAVSNQDFAFLRDSESGYHVIHKDGREMLCFFCKSERGWSYIIIEPSDAHYGSEDILLKNLKWLLVLAIITSVILTVFTAKKLSLPIRNIQNLLKKQDYAYSVDDFIYEVTMLVENNRELNIELQQQKKVLEIEVLKNILMGNIITPDDIDENIRKTKVNVHAECYILLVVVWNEIDAARSLDEIGSLKVYFEKVILDYNVDYGFAVEHIIQIDLERTAILLSGSCISREDLKKHCECYIKSVLEAANMVLMIAVGGDICESIYHLSRSFFNIQKTLDVSRDIFGVQCVQWYDTFQEYTVNKRIEDKFEGQKKSDNQERLVNDIVQYIEENYMDPMLTLEAISMKFHFTTVYVSRVFKKIKGDNLSKYIESVRLRRAKEYLSDGVKVTDIPVLVGYNSVQVFRRAWKRFYGATPSAIIENNKREAEL